MSFKEKLKLQIISLKEGIQEEKHNSAVHFIDTLSICNFNGPKEKVQMYKWEKKSKLDTGLTNVSYFYVQLYKFKKAILYVCTKVVYTQVCTQGSIHLFP